MTNSIERGKYRHYKGGEYEVYGEAVDRETGEISVVYRSLDDGQLWTRPFPNFTEIVTDDRGSQVPRFTRIGDAETAEGQLAQVRGSIERFMNAQGHDRCWWYPEILGGLAKLLGIKQTVPSELPPRCEFEEGCRRFTREQYEEK